MKDHYSTLGVSRSASTSEIKSAYKKLAVKYHPDKNPNSESIFKEVNEAYSILSDAGKKKVYDNKMSFSNDFKRWGEAFGTCNTAASFHKKTNRKVPIKGQDIRVNFTITFESSITGIDKVIEVNRKKRCSLCDGTGASKQKQCTICKGKGVVRKVHKATSIEDDNSIQVDICNNCGGTGLVIETPCTLCKGETILSETKHITVKIPSGVEDGNLIKVIGSGNAGRNGGANGDILAYIEVIEDSKFIRKGNDIYMSFDVSPSDLVLGADIKINVFGKIIKAVIPKGTKSTAKLKLKKHGIKDGSLFITFTVLVPTDASDAEIELYEKLRELEWNCGN
jgi:molecular chaperone DnaJ